jgi:hypothetical protein
MITQDLDMATTDYRARLKAKPGQRSELFKQSTEWVLGPNDPANVLYPLYATGGLIFPYTPVVTVAGTANYEELAFTHSNYKQLVYKNSTPSEIIVTGKFVSQTLDEAKYTLAVLHFLRSVTKSYTGAQTAGQGLSGTPPPILLFDYNGTYMYKDVPVIIKSYTMELSDTVDYVPVKHTETNISYVPALTTVSVTLDYQYNPNKLMNSFNLDSFRRGNMISGSNGSHNGGYI